MGEAIGPVSIGSGRVPGEMIRGDDPLPTHELVATVVAQATKRRRAGVAADLVAHAALARLCPQVMPARLARMLFIDPADLVAHGSAPAVAEAAAEIVTSIQGEG